MCYRLCIPASEVRTEEFFKAAKINSLISMALLYSKHGTCYFIELILTFYDYHKLPNIREAVSTYMYSFTETATRKLAQSFRPPHNSTKKGIEKQTQYHAISNDEEFIIVFLQLEIIFMGS